GVGWSLTLAAVSLLAGFFSFLPTDFRGVSELGLIAGVGMIVAYLFSLTMLPALIAVLRPPGEKQEVGTASMASVDHWILEHRKLVLVLTGLVTVAGLPLLYWLPFDSNPMHLRSAKVESVATYLDLAKDPKTSPNSIDVVVPNRDAIDPMVKKLTALPGVAGVVDINTFVPADQDQKLATIEDAAQVLGPVLNPPRVAPAPTDREVVTAIRNAVTALR
ncbi:hopanoid biosynthesis associated RND transporter HpnN, partial [Methylobacterium indicum]